jgi:hypothetical protein
LKKNDVFASLDHAHCGCQRLVQLVVIVGFVQLVVVQLGHGSQRGMKETHTKTKIIFFLVIFFSRLRPCAIGAVRRAAWCV